MQFLTRLFLLVFTLVSAIAFAVSPNNQDFDLIEQLSKNNIRLIVMRHGQSQNNVWDFLTSSTSPGLHLTSKGEEQVATSSRNLLSEAKVDWIYTSPVYRTLQTAQIAGTVLNVPYNRNVVDNRLKEQFFGDFEYSKFENYLSVIAPDSEYGNNNLSELHFCTAPPEEVYIYGAPNGETGAEVFARTRDLLWSIAENHNNETVMLVTHGFNWAHIGKCLTGSYAELPYNAQYIIYDYKN